MRDKKIEYVDYNDALEFLRAGGEGHTYTVVEHFTSKFANKKAVVVQVRENWPRVLSPLDEDLEGQLITIVRLEEDYWATTHNGFDVEFGDEDVEGLLFAGAAELLFEGTAS